MAFGMGNSILGGSTAQGPILGGGQQMPNVPWSKNRAVTMAALGMLGAPTLDQGIQRAASLVPAGIDANTAWQKNTQDRMDRDKRAAAMSAWMRSQSGLDLSPEEQSVLAGSPEVGEALFGASLKKRFEPPAGNDASLVPIWGEGPDGQPMLVQPTKTGLAIQTQLPDGFVPSKGVEKIDAGTEWLLYDKQTGGLVGRQPKDIAGAEREKIIGAGQGDRITNLPKVEQQALNMLTTLDRLEAHPGFDSAVGFVGGMVPDWAIPPGTDMRGFNSLLKQVQGQSFLQAFESLKGGGQITEVEGRRATEAINRLERGLKPEEFRQAINEIREVINIGLERARNGVVVGAQTDASQAPVPPATDGDGWTEIAPGVRIREVQ